MITIDFTTKTEIMPDYVLDDWGYNRLCDENGKLHSYNDLPAVIWPNGSKVWFKHGKIHRDNNGLPAIVYSDGSKYWYIDDKFIKKELQ